MNTKGSTHLTKEERKLIERLLNEDYSCKDIAAVLCKNDRTISREIKKRRDSKANGRHAFVSDNYDIPTCKRIERFPFVCNGCPPNKRKTCYQPTKYYYDSDLAQENYKIILSDTRTGLDVSLEEKIKFDTILYDGIKKGQSIHHIVETHKDKLRYSERSAYRLVDKNKTIVQSVDLRRKVKLKPRKHYSPPKEDNKAIREGRKYVDFLSFISKNNSLSVTEIDTVESVLSSSHKCLLTIHSTATHFMLIYVLDRKTKDCVSNKFLELQKMFGIDDYKRFFNVSLTDRGTEFCDPLSLEMDFSTGEQLANLFFCNSYSSYQKGALEENHRLIRYIIPKGTIFDDLTQEKADLIASHINSFYRKSIDACPYDLAVALFGESFIKKTKIRKINPDLVTLNNSLLK